VPSPAPHDRAWTTLLHSYSSQTSEVLVWILLWEFLEHAQARLQLAKGFNMPDFVCIETAECLPHIHVYPHIGTYNGTPDKNAFINLKNQFSINSYAHLYSDEQSVQQGTLSSQVPE
jgi:hypothetical protein